MCSCVRADDGRPGDGACLSMLNREKKLKESRTPHKIQSSNLSVLSMSFPSLSSRIIMFPLNSQGSLVCARVIIIRQQKLSNGIGGKSFGSKSSHYPKSENKTTIARNPLAFVGSVVPRGESGREAIV